jgi:four helix bundle suffix protein
MSERDQFPKKAGSDRSGEYDRSERSPSNRLRPSGGYRTLRSFRAATLVYDGTVTFCERFLDPRSRTVDQMVQAARSGRQNIAEGSRASAASSQTELRLVNVARASLDELLLDYEDFLRQRGLRQWSKEDTEAKEVHAVGRTMRDPTDRWDRTDQTDAAAYAHWLHNPDPAVMANALICLIHQANYLLDHQIAGLEQCFVAGGGYTERLAAARVAERARKDRSELTDRTGNNPQAPKCPLCGKPLVLRTAKKGAHPGAQFWGCSAYPACHGSRPLE